MGLAGEEGLNEAAIRTWETMHLGDEFDVEVGSTEVLGRFAEQSSDTMAAMLPNASFDWRKGSTAIGYRVATFHPGTIQSDDTQAGTWLPEFSLRNGKLVIQRGLHQEIGWERKTDLSEMNIQVFSDEIRIRLSRRWDTLPPIVLVRPPLTHFSTGQVVCSEAQVQTSPARELWLASNAVCRVETMFA